MNNSELEKLLKTAPVPERTPDYWEQFPKRVTESLRNNQKTPASLPARPEQYRAKWSLAVWGLSLATACIVIGFAIGFWKGRNSVPSAQQFAQMQKYFHEIEALFPNQVQAIVFDGPKAELVLSDTPNLPASPPILITIAQAHTWRRVITFSGQKLRINGDTCEVLLNAQGQVLLVGPKWFWCSAEPREVRKTYHISAARLEAVL